MFSKLLRLRFESALHHGCGYGLAGLVDRPLLRDGKKIPYLSGAAIKGKFRWAALRILKTQKNERLCGQEQGEFCRTDPCRLCRIFGSPWQEGGAVFREAYPVNEEREVLELAMTDRTTAGATVRATTGLERKRRVVKKYHLFTTEVAPALIFEGSVAGNLDERDWKLLADCALILTHFGADGSRGLGRCNYELVTVEAAE